MMLYARLWGWTWEAVASDPLSQLDSDDDYLALDEGIIAMQR